MKLSLLVFGGLAAALALACSGGSDGTCSSSGEALSVCATGSVVKGVDVSIYQGSVDWSKVKAAGKVFAIARVSDGTGTIDSTFATNWKGMKAQGLVRGVYQFFEPGDDPTKQADLVSSQVKSAGGFDAGDLPPVMDMEVTGGQTDATIQSHMQTWLDTIEKSIGRKPIIYTNLNTSSHFGGKFTGYPLWVASWGASCPTMPNGFKGWKFWQDADNGSVSGISGAVDTDEFNGTLADLKAWADPPETDAGAPPPKDAGASDSGAARDASPPTEDASAPAPEPDAGPVNPCAP
ncbi:MAG TPA: GH25 family lysozyme [Polyangiaceae bacterium]|jgi:lysozyme